MSAAAAEPLAHVLARAQHVLGRGRAAEDATVAVVGRFLRREEPDWLRDRPDAVRLDVLAACELVARRCG